MKVFWCLALAPLALYLLLLGWVNLRRRPMVMAGSRDVNLMGMALIGLAIVGPLELFLPEAAAFTFGPWVWLLMIALYFLLVSLTSMMLRPRLVIYNMTRDELRPVMAEVARKIDPTARWTGDGLTLPKLAVRLHMECSQTFRNVQLVSVGSDQNDSGWRKLESELRRSLRTTETERNARGVPMLITALVFIGLVAFLVLRDSREIAASIWQLLRL